MDVLTLTPVRNAVTCILQSPVLSGFGNNQFQQMRLRGLDLKRDHSRDSEALRSPLTVKSTATEIQSSKVT